MFTQLRAPADVPGYRVPTAMEDNTTPDTSNFLDWVEIKNFKSIKDLRLDCKRVNIFIGKPNVGKSNILEALGMLGAGYNTTIFSENSIRYKEIRHLYYDNDILSPVDIASNNVKCSLVGSPITIPDNPKYTFTIKLTYNKKTQEYHQLLFENGQIGYGSHYLGYIQSVKKFDFLNLTSFDRPDVDRLLPPNGINLYNTVRRHKALWSEFAKLFAEQGLELVMFDANQEFIIQKKVGPYINQYQYYTIADTFRRFMFYIAAIESNTNSVIVFEEPEVHSFPPYTQDVAYRMIYSETNQFFVSTHSPYLLQTLVENLSDDQLSVFVTYYDNYETKVKALTPDELSFVQEYSTDVFFNLDRFIPTSNAASVS